VQSSAVKRAFSLADQLKLNAEERHEFGEMLLKKDLKTWRTLREEDAGRLVDGLYGAYLFTVLREQRVPESSQPTGS